MFSLIEKLVNRFKVKKIANNEIIINDFFISIKNNQIDQIKYKDILVFENFQYQAFFAQIDKTKIKKEDQKIVFDVSQSKNQIFQYFEIKNKIKIINGSIIFSFNKNNLIIEKRYYSNVKTYFEIIMSFETSAEKTRDKYKINDLNFSIDSTEDVAKSKNKVFIKKNISFKKFNKIIVKNNNRSYETTKILFGDKYE